MNPKVVQKIKIGLESLLQGDSEAKEQLSVMTEQGLTEQGKGDAADCSLSRQEQTLKSKMQWRQALFLNKVKKAIRRIESGEFDECEECGGSIGETRLLARPTATYCLSCKEAQESIEAHIPYRRRAHTLGKELRLNG